MSEREVIENADFTEEEQAKILEFREKYEALCKATGISLSSCNSCIGLGLVTARKVYEPYDEHPVFDPNYWDVPK